MKASWKKILLTVAAVAVIAVTVFYFYYYKPKSENQPAYIDPAFSEFIATYTAGVVQSSSTIRIVLAQDAADSTMIGQESLPKLFDFSPSLKGKAYWLDSKTIEFRPDQRMPSGQEYEVTFLLIVLLLHQEAGLWFA